MSSTASSVTPTSKIAPPSTSSAFFQGPPNNASDSSQRRTGSAGSFGAGSASRNNPQARNNQPLRKQHKAQRRARLADEDVIAESTAMKSINSRKGQTSITHLMNFSLPPRPYFQHQHHTSNHRHQRRNPTWGLGSGYHAMDKARYVHANYRFIVRPDLDYQDQTVDADIHVGWDSVLQILASALTQSTNCPICLSVPVAPRMAKCGHIFCLPCLIRYMHSTDDATPIADKRARWKKCPICEDSIYISETRPVRWFEGQEASLLREGGDVLLKLVMREPGTTLALPRDVAEGHDQRDDIPWYNVAEIMDYARFMKGGEAYMKSQYDEEVVALESQEKEDELMFGDDDTWTKKAINSINDAKLRLEGIGDPPEDVKKTRREPIQFAPAEDTPYDYRQSQLPNERIPPPTLGIVGQTSESNVLATTLNNLKLDWKAPDPAAALSGQGTAALKGHVRPPNHPFFFYHALPNFFLSPLDIRILKAAYGDFSMFPSTTLPRVEHISTGHVVDDDLRKRAKYMAHLPYGCEVSFLECDWTDIISPTILEQYGEDIERRRKRNNDKAAREERERVRAEKEEDNKRWAAARTKRPSAISKSFSESDFLPLTHPEQPLGTSPGDSHTYSATPPWGNNRTHSSFATLASPGTSPDAARTVWGTALIPPSSPQLVSTTSEVLQGPVDDGWLQNWERDLLDQDDAVAVVDASLESPGGTKPSQAFRKKKGKKITLMSTNARRGA